MPSSTPKLSQQIRAEALWTCGNSKRFVCRFRRCSVFKVVKMFWEWLIETFQEEIIHAKPTVLVSQPIIKIHEVFLPFWLFSTVWVLSHFCTHIIAFLSNIVVFPLKHFINGVFMTNQFQQYFNHNWNFQLYPMLMYRVRDQSPYSVETFEKSFFGQNVTYKTSRAYPALLSLVSCPLYQRFPKFA